MIECVKTRIDGTCTVEIDGPSYRLVVPFHAVTSITTTMILADREIMRAAVEHAVTDAVMNTLRKIKSLDLYPEKDNHVPSSPKES